MMVIAYCIAFASWSHEHILHKYLHNDRIVWVRVTETLIDPKGEVNPIGYCHSPGVFCSSMSLSSTRPKLIFQNTKQVIGFCSVVEDSPLHVILIFGIHFQTNAYHMIGDGVMKSSLTVRGFIDLRRVIDVSRGVKHIDDFMHRKCLLVFSEKVLLGRDDELFDAFSFLL